MIHDTTTCACEMCTYFDKQMAEGNTLHVKLAPPTDHAADYFDFLWQYGPASKLGIDRATALWWFQMGRASNE